MEGQDAKVSSPGKLRRTPGLLGCTDRGAAVRKLSQELVEPDSSFKPLTQPPLLPLTLASPVSLVFYTCHLLAPS